MNRRDRRRMEKMMSNEQTVQGLGIATAEPDKNKLFEPQIMSNGDPCLYADWFQISGGIGNLLTITFGKFIPNAKNGVHHLVKETCTIAVPGEIAVDLRDKISQAYPEKK